MTTCTKAHVAGVSGVIGLVVGYYLTWIPWWASMPMEVQAAHVVIVVGGLNWLATYYAPANKQVLPDVTVFTTPPLSRSSIFSASDLKGE